LIGSTFYPISVSKAYTNRRKGIKHRPNTKKVWFVYGYEHDEIEETLTFKSFRVNLIKTLYHKMNMGKIKEYHCNECEGTSYYITKGFEKIKECSICESNDLDNY
jgi:hypothetical protein